ncbi:hypothetical protein ACO2RV_05375 [Ancylobacter sp. VNQ12]|uniref:hypothetical protein n=1 Tax=Ancylobacter sp. VNQ12 TaxID=3400920 RepID=UPI003BFC2E2F
MRVHSALMATLCLAAPALVAAAPASAEPMNVDAAQRFVYGRTFSYSCYEGTAGAGRIMPDGSVAGTIQMRGKGNARYVTLPAGTIMVKGDKVCAKVKGLAFQPCFELDKLSDKAFRGNLAGADRLWCEFNRGNGRTRLAERASPKPAEPAAAAPTVEVTVANEMAPPTDPH